MFLNGMSSSSRDHHLLGLVYICILSFSPSKVKSQTFTRTCADPLVDAHIQTFGHTYCYHTCGYFQDPSLPDMSMCTAAGNCICNYACDSEAPADTFATDICPPLASDAPDTNAMAMPMCQMTCSAACTGGTGMICGEVEPLGPNQDIFAKVCTCYCPPQPCVTNPTGPTVAPTPTTQPTVIINNFNCRWLAFLKKLLKLGFLLCKLLAPLLLLLLLPMCLYRLSSSFGGWSSFMDNIDFTLHHRIGWEP